MPRTPAVAALVALITISVLPALAINVVLTAKADNPEHPVIVGKTNLPDGTELMVTISRKASSFMAQDKTRVMKGEFRAGPFSQNGSALNPGTYAIEISSPIASVQPASVQTVIGQGGSNLGGPLAKRSEFGGKVIEYKTTFQVGGGKNSASLDQVSRQQERENRHEWWLQSCRDTCNLTKGYATQRGESFDWNRCYSKCLTEEPNKK
jgi:hypothetical protein